MWVSTCRMVSALYYQTEAARCRELAAATKDEELARQWLKLAREYDALADSAEGRFGVPPPDRFTSPCSSSQCSSSNPSQSQKTKLVFSRPRLRGRRDGDPARSLPGQSSLWQAPRPAILHQTNVIGDPPWATAGCVRRLSCNAA